MIRRPPRSTRTDTLFPSPTLFRSWLLAAGSRKATCLPWRSAAMRSRMRCENFESLNPANTWWQKNYNLYANADTGRERFLEFERWWSSYFFLSREEILAPVENLFIGNRLEQGQVQLDPAGPARTEERRVGQECVSKCRTRWWPYH